MPKYVNTIVTWTMRSSVSGTSRSVGSLHQCVVTAVRLQGATVCTRKGPVVRREIPNPYTISLALLVNQINSFGGLISRVDLWTLRAHAILVRVYQGRQ